MSTSAILGIMVCHVRDHLFNEKNYYRFLQKLGNKYNLLVYVFYPNNLDWARKQVKGFNYNTSLKKWELKWFPMPDYVYDRCFYTSKQAYAKYKPYVTKIRQAEKIKFLGIGLKGKWEVHQILSGEKNLSQHLLPTAKFSTETFRQWIENFPIVIKPLGGSHGIGVVKISKENEQYKIIGRNFANKSISAAFHQQGSLLKWVEKFIQRKNYLIQQYADLTTSSNQPYDIRILIQKNQQGEWEITGMAARLGHSSSITSNLHGGGGAKPVEVLLEKEFGELKTAELISQLKKLAKNVPPVIEAAHGRLFEIGLDIGIDRKGNLWIIEANSKPGRQVFTLLKDTDKRRKALSQPIFYTLYLRRGHK